MRPHSENPLSPMNGGERGQGVRGSVSVIIPAYNAADTIAQAIQSALLQSPAPIEVIVADDGSLDRTADVAEQAGAKVLRLSHANGSVARNRGTEAAAGEILFFLDADDWWKPGKIAAHLKVWEADDPSFVIDPSTIVKNGVDAPGRLLGAGCQGPVAWEDFLEWTTWTGGSSFSVRRDRYQSILGFNESLISQQDVDFWIRAAHMHGPAYRLAESFTFYRLSPGGISKRPRNVAMNLETLLESWSFASERQKYDFFVQLTLTAAGFSRIPESLKYFHLAGWPLWKGKFYRALARSILETARRRHRDAA
ncbi:MAG: glycosyltransferase family 2 protein [Fimbriimonadaceae bacterium]